MNRKLLFVGSAACVLVVLAYFPRGKKTPNAVLSSSSASALRWSSEERSAQASFGNPPTTVPGDLILELHRPWVRIGNQIVFELSSAEFEKIAAAYGAENADRKATIQILGPTSPASVGTAK